MGEIYNLTCRNKECRYHVEIRDGSGWSLFRYEMGFIAVAAEQIEFGIPSPDN